MGAWQRRSFSFDLCVRCSINSDLLAPCLFRVPRNGWQFKSGLLLRHRHLLATAARGTSKAPRDSFFWNQRWLSAITTDGLTKEGAMSVAKITEISSQSPEGFDDAVRRGLERASSTLKNIKGAWVKDHKVEFDGKKITNYIVHMKVTFVLNE
jgi:dodecin